MQLVQCCGLLSAENGLVLETDQKLRVAGGNDVDF